MLWIQPHLVFKAPIPDPPSPAFGMICFCFFIDSLTVLKDICCYTTVPLVWCQEIKAAMPVFVVVPTNELEYRIPGL